jgi:amino acid transporter
MAMLISASGQHGFPSPFFLIMANLPLVSELVSAYPTAGGMYFVCKHVVPSRHVPIWSWIVGWCNFVGQAAGVSALAYTVSQMLLAAISMNSRLEGDRYQFSPYVICRFKFVGVGQLMFL